MLKSNIYGIFKKLVIILLAGLLLQPMFNRTAAIAATKINLSASSRIDGENILLGDIAQFEGDDAQLIHRLKGVIIGRSPLPGRVRKIEARDVKRRLKQNRIDINQLVLQAPPQIMVERSFIEISQEKIKSLVVDYIERNIINKHEDANIKEIRVSDKLKLPGGRITYTVKPARASDLVGKIPFSVSFNVNGKIYKRVWAAATVEVVTSVVVTRKPLGRHKPITEDDIEIQKLDLAQLPFDVVTDPEVILGQRTRRAIGSQTVLRTSLVEFPPLLKRGDVVVIVAESDGLKITTLGQAKKKGRLGERIPVINFDSKKILYARVLDANTVKVDLK